MSAAKILAFIPVLLGAALVPSIARAEYSAASEADILAWGAARGGDEIRFIDNGDGSADFIHIFTSTNTTHTLVNSFPREALILAVGGGGSGGADCGGGGGAGGVVTNSVTFAPGVYSVRVGAGGIGKIHSGAVTTGESQSATLWGDNGGDTAVTNTTTGAEFLLAYGGGGGGSYAGGNGTQSSPGRAGGSGGGASGATGTTYRVPGAATQTAPGLGNAGSQGYGNNIGGGGGGALSAGASGATSTKGAAGGAGIELDITGESVVYAKGGAGGSADANVAYGGGDSSDTYGDSGNGNQPGQPGRDGTGSGGGGGGRNAYRRSGAGGSGIFVVRYTVTAAEKPQAVAGSDSAFYYRFTESAPFVVTGAIKARILAVGGGGAGASPAASNFGGAGGGGAGEVKDVSDVILNGGTYNIYIGAGGAAGGTTQQEGADGSPTAITNATTNAEVIYALGGGGGGQNKNTTTSGVGRSGASGGGGSSFTPAVPHNGGTATSSTGHNGGAGKVIWAGGGGGGAGSAGGDATTANKGGAGGDALAVDITGTVEYFGAGGGGGSRTGTGGAGGSGLGGTGGGSEADATAGAAGTGSGGGGGKQNGPGGAGGSGCVIIRVEAITTTPLVKPVDGSLLYTTDASGAAVEQTYWEYDANFFDVTGDTAATKVGSYSFTATPKTGVTWTDGTSAAVTCNWKIEAPTLEVVSFFQDGWQVGVPTVKPDLVTTPQVSESEGTVVYVYYSGDTKLDAAPTEPGTYRVVAEIQASENYKLPASNPEMEFEIWEADTETTFSDIFAYHARIDISYTGEAVSNFPMLVKIAENTPAGFHYRDAGEDGAELRFADADGNLIPHEVDGGWNEDGETLIWVKVPKYADGEHITMNWGALEGVEYEENDPAEVWSAYAGVWHFQEYATAATAASVKNADSTGHGMTATPNNTSSDSNVTISQMVSTEAIFGNGRVNMSYPNTSMNGPYLNIERSTIPDLKGSFTFSGWVKFYNYAQSPRIVSAKNSYTARGNGTWEVELTSPRTSIIARANGSDATTAQVSTQLLINNTFWTYLTVVYDGTETRVYGLEPGGVVFATTNTVSTGVVAGDPAYSLSFGNNASGNQMSLQGAYDEFRIKFGAVDEAWIAADYAQAAVAGASYAGTATAGYTFGKKMTSEGLTIRNRWLVYPSVSKTAWSKGEASPTVYAGEPLYGAPSYWYVVDSTGNVYERGVMPTEDGRYTLVFKADAGEGEYRNWGALTTEVVLLIKISSPYSSLAGGAGSATLSGRVLLANDDGEVAGQGYYRTDSALYDTYWTHDGAIEGNNRWPYSPAYSHHIFSSTNAVDELCGATEIWELSDVRIGNTYYSSLNLQSDQNYLPWSSTGSAFSSASITAKGLQAESAHLLMRNVENAAIYSPCYTNGIGTIYFDAVNGWTSEDGAGYTLVLEVVTDVIDADGEVVEGAIPSNENVHEVLAPTSVVDPDTLEVTIVEGKTNRWAFANWKPVEMTVLKSDSKTFAEAFTTNELALAESTGASYSNFYRVYATVDTAAPCRFRLRRTSAVTGDTDTTGLILVDNIEVSYPAMRADLAPLGAGLDQTRGGHQVLGWEGAFTPKFPAVGDTIYGAAQATFRTNPATNVDAAAFISAATLHYRWRYANQAASDWKEVGLARDTLKAGVPLTLPADSPGDIEFWYETTLNAPFYTYVDYSGTGLGVGSYTEEAGTVTNACNSSATLDTLGTDWFIRLRESQSDYESMVLETVLGGVTNAIPMELTGVDMWRGAYQTKAGASGTMSFRIRPVTLDYVTETDEETGLETSSWQRTTNLWYWAETDTSIPLTGNMIGSDEDVWGTIELDDTTGYILFQIEDATRALSVVHADYQNFNYWNDAHNSYFTGAYTDADGAKSGASPEAKSWLLDFSGWDSMTATNKNWTEKFEYTSGLEVQETFYREYPDITTPNGWSAQNAAYVYGRYMVEDSGGAMQLAGEGQGLVQYVKKTGSPRGVDTVTFSARIGQSIAFEDASTWKILSPSDLENYTFVVKAAYDRNSNADFRGAATLSLFANYQEDQGAYEFRMTQRGGNATTGLGNAAAYNSSDQSKVFSLYRWAYDEDEDAILPTLLACVTNSTFKMPLSTSSTDTAYLPMFISCSNSVVTTGRTATTNVWITVGCGEQSATSSGIHRYCTGVVSQPATDTTDNASGKGYFMMTYRDATPHGLTCGSFGVESANCPAYFTNPCWHEGNVPPTSTTLSAGSLGQSAYTVVNFPGSPNWTYSGTTAAANDSARRWTLDKSRMEMFRSSTSQYEWGIRAKAAPVQTLSLYTAAAGTSDNWTVITNCTVSGYGTLSGATSTYNVQMRTLEDCSLRLKVSGNSKNGVIIDDVSLSQWRGADYADETEMRPLMHDPVWVNPDDIYAQTNFIFYSGWILDHRLLLSARRTLADTDCGIRSPLFDGEFGRTKGLGMLSFKYEDAQENVNLLVQIATNVSYGALSSAKWTTVTNFSFAGVSAEDRASGTRGVYLGLHGVNGMFRVVMDPDVVSTIQKSTNESAFGDIYITEIYCRDEPEIDDACWTGWNVRSIGEATDSEGKMYLPDVSRQKVGLSLALNNSIEEDIDPNLTSDIYAPHAPYVQTPLFGTNVVGEIAFRARRYETSSRQPAQVVLYGTTNPGNEAAWKELETFVVSNKTFSTLYSYKTNPSESYNAFRLAVAGVDGVDDGGTIEGGYSQPVRVLLDEVLVSEAIRARIGFRNVGVFRSDLNTTGRIDGVPSKEEQPICGEDWGVQCQIYAAQLGDEIDFNRTPQVYLHWFEGVDPWGYENWSTNRAAKTARLAIASGTNLFYRSSYITAKDAVIPLSLKNTTIQYTLEVVYYQKGYTDPVTNRLSSIDWTEPEWYNPVDYNGDFGSDGAWSAYNIIDAVPYGWAWINEANVFGAYNAKWQDVDRYNQFVEIAAPQEADLSGWKVQMLNAQLGSGLVYTNTIATFGSGEGQPSGKKSLNVASNMTFRVIANKHAVTDGDLKKSDGTLDAIWDWEVVDYEAFLDSGLLSPVIPVGVQLVRPSKIVEHQVVFMGTNMFATAADDHTYDPTNLVERLNERLKAADFLWTAFDQEGVENSVGVTNENGSVQLNWSPYMKKTPGRINEGQYINPDHPTPNGTSMIIYSNLEGGNIWQVDDTGEFTTESRVIIIQKGTQMGTNITYRVGPWYELATPVTFEGQSAIAPVAGSGTREYVLPAVGAGVSNNVTITAHAQPNSTLREYGVDDSNRYKDAIINWLNRGKDAFGNAWPEADEDTIYLADYMTLQGNVVTNLDLTTMYWLDMCPTFEGLALAGGPAASPTPVSISYVNQQTGATVTHDNVRYSLCLYITNRNENAATQLRGLTAWAPYTLQGSDADTFARLDDDATFKLMAKKNLATSGWDLDSWVPLRYFTFAQDSFDENFQATIELMDPAKNEAWYYWDKAHPESAGDTGSMYFQWSIDARTAPYEVETLTPNSIYTNE